MIAECLSSGPQRVVACVVLMTLHVTLRRYRQRGCRALQGIGCCGFLLKIRWSVCHFGLCCCCCTSVVMHVLTRQGQAAIFLTVRVRMQHIDLIVESSNLWGLNRRETHQLMRSLCRLPQSVLLSAADALVTGRLHKLGAPKHRNGCSGRVDAGRQQCMNGNVQCMAEHHEPSIYLLASTQTHLPSLHSGRDQCVRQQHQAQARSTGRLHGRRRCRARIQCDNHWAARVRSGRRAARMMSAKHCATTSAGATYTECGTKRCSCRYQAAAARTASCSCCTVPTGSCWAAPRTASHKSPAAPLGENMSRFAVPCAFEDRSHSQNHLEGTHDHHASSVHTSGAVLTASVFLTSAHMWWRSCFSGGTLNFNFPLDVAYRSCNVFGWPQLVVCVYGADFRGRDVIKGYGAVRLPTCIGRWPTGSMM